MPIGYLKIAVLRFKMPAESRTMAETKTRVKPFGKRNLRPGAFTHYRFPDTSTDSDFEPQARPKIKVNANLRSGQKKRLNRSQRPVSPDKNNLKATEDFNSGSNHPFNGLAHPSSRFHHPLSGSDDPFNGTKSVGATLTEADRIELELQLSWSSR